MVIVANTPARKAAAVGVVQTVVGPPEKGVMVDMDVGEADGCEVKTRGYISINNFICDIYFIRENRWPLTSAV